MCVNDGLYGLTFPAPHNAQCLIGRHCAYVRPTWIADSANDSATHLTISAFVELADERLVRAEAEGCPHWIVDVDAVAIDSFSPCAAASPVWAGAIIDPNELYLNTLWGGYGEEGECEHEKKGDRVYHYGGH